MFNVLYDCVLLVLSLLALPLLLWQRLFYGKYRHSLFQRFGINLPNFSKNLGDKVVWIHTISMGEVRACLPMYKQIRSAYPSARIVISTVTETGQTLAKQNMPEADLCLYLPLDLSWVMKKLMRQIQPNVVFLTEGGFWYQFLSQSKKWGARNILINGKISERSYLRFTKVPGFFRRIVSSLDLLCVQNQEYAERFISLGADPSSVVITGNVKLESPVVETSQADRALLRNHLALQEGDFVITLASTHYPEEDMMISQLYPICLANSRLKVLLVPRHPERFAEVARMLAKKQIPYHSYSQSLDLTQQLPQVILIDQMGILLACYQISDLAIVAGSFIDKIGGHNIFEPILLGVPVFFGPFMFAQKDLQHLCLSSQTGEQISIDQLGARVADFIEDRESKLLYIDRCRLMQSQVGGAINLTWQACAPLVEKAFL